MRVETERWAKVFAAWGDAALVEPFIVGFAPRSLSCACRRPHHERRFGALRHRHGRTQCGVARTSHSAKKLLELACQQQLAPSTRVTAIF
jgi:hypothetical protein